MAQAKKKVRLKHHPIVGSFGLALRDARKKAGFSQHELARQAHINIGYIGKLERGEAAPGLDMVARLAESLSVQPADLIATVGASTNSFEVAKNQLLKKINSVISRADIPTIQALALIAAHADSALARNR